MWSEADLPLLDYLEAQINGIDERYGHIVVDEAQDLSPMQLRSIAMRSSSGSMTVVGDIAQSTGRWARDDWDDVLDHLPSQLPHRFEELRYGYRVPRQVFEVAEQLLPLAAPDVAAPLVVRDGPADPVFSRADDDSRAGIAVEAAMAHASHGRSVALTRTTRYLHVVGPLPALGPEQPVDISDFEQTRTLALPLPVAIGTAAVPAPREPATAEPGRRGGGLSARIVELVAAELAEQMRENVQPAQWRAVLDRVGELLDVDGH